VSKKRPAPERQLIRPAFPTTQPSSSKRKKACRMSSTTSKRHWKAKT